MTLEIPFNKDYKFIIDPKKAQGDDTNQHVWTKRLNKVGKHLMNMPEFYAFTAYAIDVLDNNGNQSIKDECNSLLLNIRKDIRNNIIMTGTGIYTTKNSGQIIHNKYDNLITVTKIDSLIPEYSWQSVEGINDEYIEGFLQNMFLTRDNKSGIIEVMKKLESKTLSIDTQKDGNYAPVLLYSNNDIFYISCLDILGSVGCARGVTRIAEGDAKKITLSGIINDTYSKKFSEDQQKIFKDIDKNYTMTPKN